ncbi:unnamed protein product [Arctogadus glacialis]
MLRWKLMGSLGVWAVAALLLGTSVWTLSEAHRTGKDRHRMETASASPAGAPDEPHATVSAPALRRSPLEVRHQHASMSVRTGGNGN